MKTVYTVRLSYIIIAETHLLRVADTVSWTAALQL